MAKATVEGYDGKVEFDEMCYDNNQYDLYCVAVCDPETNEVIEEEHYTREAAYRDALYSVHGREVMDEQTEDGSCDVKCNGRYYECDAIYHIAYVIDHDE